MRPDEDEEAPASPGEEETGREPEPGDDDPFEPESDQPEDEEPVSGQPVSGQPVSEGPAIIRRRRGERTEKHRPAGPAPAVEPRRILYRDESLIAYDKPGGVPVHWGTEHPQGLAEVLEEWIRERPRPGKEGMRVRVAPLHRLDLEATGVVLFGLTRKVSGAVQGAFEAGIVRKRYIAVVAGPVEEEGEIAGKVRSRLRREYRWVPSSLTYRRLAGDERLSLVEVVPQGGRTHQIRALFAGAGRPLAGDLRYGRPKPARQFLEKFGVERLLLHALELTLPAGVLDRSMTFRAPLPPEYRRVMAQKGWSAGATLQADEPD